MVTPFPPPSTAQIDPKCTYVIETQGHYGTLDLLHNLLFESYRLESQSFSSAFGKNHPTKPRGIHPATLLTHPSCTAGIPIIYYGTEQGLNGHQPKERA